jgi:hypothetical protein
MLNIEAQMEILFMYMFSKFVKQKLAFVTTNDS